MIFGKQQAFISVCRGRRYHAPHHVLDQNHGAIAGRAKEDLAVGGSGSQQQKNKKMVETTRTNRVQGANKPEQDGHPRGRACCQGRSQLCHHEAWGYHELRSNWTAVHWAGVD